MTMIGNQSSAEGEDATGGKAADRHIGNIQHTDAKSQFPIRGEVIVKFGNGVFTPVSGLKIPKL